MKTSIYIRVGILFVVATVIIFWGINYLKGRDLLKFEKHYYSMYDRIGGLTRSSPVTINGFQVGQVRDIRLSGDSSAFILVKFSIDNKSIRIPAGSDARIYSTDLMGTKGIALLFSKEEELCAAGDTLSGSIEEDLRNQVNTQMLPLKIRAEELMSSMDSVLIALRLVFNEDNRENLGESFSSVNSTLNSLQSASQYLNVYVKEEAQKISLLLSNIDSIVSSLLGHAGQFGSVLDNISRVSDTIARIPLAGTVLSLNHVLDDLHLITNEINQGNGSLGHLIYSDSLYSALLATNAGLERLIEDVRVNPGRYIHFSLMEQNRTFFNLNDSKLAQSIGSEGPGTYYVCIAASDKPLTSESPEIINRKDVRFLQVGGRYYYFSNQGTRIEACIRQLDRERKNYPQAAIYTWINGIWTALEI